MAIAMAAAASSNLPDPPQPPDRAKTSALPGPEPAAVGVSSSSRVAARAADPGSRHRGADPRHPARSSSAARSAARSRIVLRQQGKREIDTSGGRLTGRGMAQAGRDHGLDRRRALDRSSWILLLIVAWPLAPARARSYAQPGGAIVARSAGAHTRPAASSAAEERGALEGRAGERVQHPHPRDEHEHARQDHRERDEHPEPVVAQEAASPRAAHANARVPPHSGHGRPVSERNGHPGMNRRLRGRRARRPRTGSSRGPAGASPHGVRPSLPT